jgi:alkylhydroperoxidase family enzyme
MRMHPVNPPYAPEVQALFDRLPASWAPPFLHFRIFARDPRLLARYLRGAVSYLEPSHVTLRQREVFLLRVTGRCRCAFEWTLRVHYFADEAGLTEAQVRASVLGDAGDPCWAEGDPVLVRLADELHDTSSISDQLWVELRSSVSEEAILQLLLMAGHYRTNAYLTNGLQLPPDPRVRRLFPEP